MNSFLSVSQARPLVVQGLFDKDGRPKIVGPVGIQVRTTILQDFNELG